MPIAIESSSGGSFACQDGGSAGGAFGTGGVGIREEEASCREGVNVRCGNAIRSEAAHPVIHVIDADEQNIGSIGERRRSIKRR